MIVKKYVAVFFSSSDSQTTGRSSNSKQLTVRPYANHRETPNMTGKSWTPFWTEGILVPKRVLVTSLGRELVQYFQSSIFVGSIMLNHQTYQKAL